MVTFKVKSYLKVSVILSFYPPCGLCHSVTFTTGVFFFPWKTGSRSLLPIPFSNYILQILRFKKICLTMITYREPPTVLWAWPTRWRYCYSCFVCVRFFISVGNWVQKLDQDQSVNKYVLKSRLQSSSAWFKFCAFLYVLPACFFGRSGERKVIKPYFYIIK